MQVEDVIGRRARVKILKVIYQIGELNVSEIARRTSSDYKATVRHLEALEEEGILKHKTFGRIRLYRFNEDSPKALALQKFFEEWESIKKPQQKVSKY
ncbi:MAG: winged helix-turn-helix domain-containing protein [Candidatus Bathyarchaeia archaeon]